jgi:hypothetical protein
VRKLLLRYFLRYWTKQTSVDDIIQPMPKNYNLRETNEKSWTSIIEGKTKRGVLGKEFFDINKKVVDLSHPMISDEGKEEVELYYTEELDPEGRGYQNLMRMMNEDGIFKYLPKQDDGWVDFLTPFMKLSRKEKKRYKNKN